MKLAIKIVFVLGVATMVATPLSKAAEARSRTKRASGLSAAYYLKKSKKHKSAFRAYNVLDIYMPTDTYLKSLDFLYLKNHDSVSEICETTNACCLSLKNADN